MITITGKKPLAGTVSVSGAKNASAPVICAALLFDSSTVHNVPDILDIRYFLEIIASMGVEVKRDGTSVHFKWVHPSYDNICQERMKKMRFSILLAPVILSRFGKCAMPYPGGDNIGKRPINEHIEGLKALGWSEGDAINAISLKGSHHHDDVHVQMNAMVTATENILLAAAFRPGTTYLHDSAYEPHVRNLIESLQSVGCDIDARYDHTIVVRGGIERSKHVEMTIISDYLESGTWAVIAALASREFLDIEHARIEDLRRFLYKMSSMGVKWEDRGNDTLRIYRASTLKATTLQTNVFPGISSDLQSPFSILMTQAEGVSRVHEVLYENRFHYLHELEKMKAHVVVMNPHEAMIFGKTELLGATVSSWDLRAGAAMVIAGLIAEGTTIVTNTEHIDRGYERFVEKLQNLGAEVKQEEEPNLSSKI